MATTGKAPTHRLTCFDKTNQRRGEIGAAWLEADGSFSIQLNPGCGLVYSTDIVIKLWPVTPETRDAGWTPATRVPRPTPKPSSGFDDMDDDIPF